MFYKAKDVFLAIVSVIIIGGVGVAIPIIGIVLGIVFSIWIGYYILQDRRKTEFRNQQSNQKD